MVNQLQAQKLLERASRKMPSKQCSDVFLRVTHFDTSAIFVSGSAPHFG